MELDASVSPDLEEVLAQVGGADLVENVLGTDHDGVVLGVRQLLAGVDDPVAVPRYPMMVLVVSDDGVPPSLLADDSAQALNPDLVAGFPGSDIRGTLRARDEVQKRVESCLAGLTPGRHGRRVLEVLGCRGQPRGGIFVVPAPPPGTR